jgi:hypothetical protein
MQKVALLPGLNARQSIERHESLPPVARKFGGKSLRLVADVLRAMFTRPPELERIEEIRARYVRVTGHSA